MLTFVLGNSTVVAYVWPAYQCFKAVESKYTEAIREWSVYWIVLACYATVEPVIDFTLFWLPLYYIAKVLLALFLWHPRTKGANYLYQQMVKPLLLKNEPEIDRRLAEGQTWAADQMNSNFKRVIDLVKANADTITKQLQSFQPKANKQQ